MVNKWEQVKKREAPVGKIQLKITRRPSCPFPRAFPAHNDPNDGFMKDDFSEAGEKEVTVASKVLLRSHM